MNAKEFLSRARLLEMQVQSKLMQVESLKSLANRMTSVYGMAPVSHTRDMTQMQSTIIRIMEVEEELNRKIDELVDTKLEIGLVIDRVEDDQLRVILEKRFLCFKKISEIGWEMHYSVRWIRAQLQRGLEEVQRILDEREGMGA